MRKLLLALSLGGSVLALAQSPALDSDPVWRSGLSSLPSDPAPGTTSQDILLFEQNMRMAAAYFGNTAPKANPAQWEANRAMVRHMATYLYGLRALSGNAQLRGSINRAQRSFDSVAFAPYLAYSMPPVAANTGQPSDGSAPPRAVSVLPFDLSAPESTGVSDADKETASDLHARYETDAAHSAVICQNVETLSQSLAAQGMSLNSVTASSVARLPTHFKAAATALSRNDWEDARTRLQQAEAETDKIAKTVGR